MSTIKTQDGAEIFYKDWTSASSVEPGRGQPVVFSHGWPLSADDWGPQMFFFASRGFRCIAARPTRIRPIQPAVERQ